jgi:NAD(P)-dependent dehydrogenase (short-subunit alcohol dehydrogenase family)
MTLLLEYSVTVHQHNGWKEENMPTVLITGANRGLGLELATQYAAQGWRVLAACRRPESATACAALAGDVQVLCIDVADHDSIAAAARQLAGEPIDVLVNNAGLFGPKRQAEQDLRQTFGHVDYAIAHALYQVNALGPLRMAEAFVEHVAASAQRKIVTLTSSVGSIERSTGGLYAYRSSKAAANMVMRSLGFDLADRGIATAALCPGWVSTDMGGPAAPLSPQQAVTGLIAVIERLERANTGRFWSYTGEELAW